MKVYYSVIAKEQKGDLWAVQFGDYDRQVAQDELCDMHDSGNWHKLKLIVTADDQAAINAEIAKINIKECITRGK